MPFPFNIPTTSATSLTSYLTCPSHPSLILAATTHRSVLRDALKKHKRLAPAAQAAHLTTIQDALTSYLPFLLIIYASVANRIEPSQNESVHVSQTRDVSVEWRSTLSSNIPGREPARVKLKGLHSELLFVLQTLGYTHTLLARTRILTVYSFTSPTAEQRAAPVTAAMKHLLDAHSIHSYASTLSDSADTHIPIDISPSTSSALASLALADATLIVVLKDDPYAAAVAEDRNKESKDWMISAPTIPKVRAHLFARLCLAAADHASKAAGLLAKTAAPGGSGKIDESLVKFAENLKKTSRGKAARFLGIDTELSAKTGEGIAWLRGARSELGFSSREDDASKSKGFKGFKHSWTERREDRKIEKGNEDWGLDAGRFEEGRIVDWLEAKWTRENDTASISWSKVSLKK